MNSGGSEYEVVIKGRIGASLQQALEGLEVTSSGPDETHLRGWLPDQPALHGVLQRIRDLGLELTAVNRIG